MKNYLKFILSYLLIFVIMVSSFGITIHNHICGKTGKTYSSILDNNDCSCSHEVKANIEDSSTPSCCANHSYVENENNSCDLSIEGDSCCSDFTDFKSLNNIFLTKNITKVISVDENDNIIERIEKAFYKQKNDLSSKFKSIKQKLKNFTSFTLKIITILNNYIQKDNPDDKQTA